MKRIYPFIALPLPYSMNALMPVIGAKTLYYHYEKLYKNYVNRLNAVIGEKPEYRELSVEEILLKAKDIPKDEDIRRYAGGVYNHEKYFETLIPVRNNRGNDFCEAFWNAVDGDYFNRNDFLEDIAETANGVFGSGYAWVAADDKGKIFVAKYANQDTPLSQGAVPLLPIDVWEHAYYLDYKHERAKHVEEVLNIINWGIVGKRYCENIF